MHRIGEEAAVGLQLRLLLGVLGEQLHRAGNRVARRVIPGEHDQQPCAVEVGVRQRIALHYGIGDRAHEVGLRIGAALGQHVAAVFEHFADVLVEQLDKGGDLRVEFAAGRHLLGLLGGDLLRRLEEVDPADELLAISLGHAQHFAQGEDRQALREFLHEVALAERRHAVEQARYLGRDARAQALDIGGGEIGHVLAAQFAMRACVEVDHRIGRGGEQDRVARLLRAERHQDAALLAAVGLRIAVHLLHAFEAGDGPEADAVARHGVPHDGRFGTHPGEIGPWLALREAANIGEVHTRQGGIGLIEGGAFAAFDDMIADEMHGSLRVQARSGVKRMLPRERPWVTTSSPPDFTIHSSR